MTFTAAEIEDARRNPVIGDVWRRGSMIREVYTTRPKDLTLMTPKRGAGGVWSYESFETWTLNATLVRRGA